ncbi:peptidoglycan-binding domain-containing protein [Variimorphobacter saccharofermentans]|uniref:peptidoglycan-binding domain-containing protein n=1 Tax=Variimorphobacter saccharofermentans TaxID=2755051 RepID=UPI001E3DF890|nr:peptidoglycan-binding domain-containing protein [Variimorphobacter saccharofermentans]
MRHKNLVKTAAVCIAAVMAFTPVNASAATLLKKGSRGNEVKVVQSTLMDLGYFTYPKTTGYYGSVTVAAVKRFQKDNGLSADGIVGKITQKALLSINTQEETENALLYTVGMEQPDMKKMEEMITGALDWFKKVKYIWDRGEDAVVTDVDTGKSFKVRRTYGTNHADVEPLTKADSKIIKEIWGGFGWERRAVTVEIGNYLLAASMTSMPHAGVDSAPAGKYVSGRSAGYGRGTNLDAVKNNGVSGVMDIHFLNSRTHTTNVKQKSQQDMVKKAAKYIENRLFELANTEEFAEAVSE